jgi:integrase
MSTDTISPLRQRMIEDMNARKLGPHSQRSHISSCKRFAAFVKRSPDTATPDDVRRFQLHLAETGMSICNRNRIMTGVKFLFRVTLRRPDLAAEIYHLREPQKIPQVMSPDETKRLLAVAQTLKVRMLLSLGYGCGLRAGEVVRLKVKHVDSAQKIIRVEQSKGRKDRNVMLSPETLDLLRQWWKARPSRHDAGIAVQERWLFSWQQVRQADDHPTIEPPVPSSRRRGRDQEGRHAARIAPLCSLPDYVAYCDGLSNLSCKWRIAGLEASPITRHSFVNATGCPESSAADLPGDNDSARRSAMRFWRGLVPSSQVLLPNRPAWSLPIHDRATWR